MPLTISLGYIIFFIIFIILFIISRAIGGPILLHILYLSKSLFYPVRIVQILICPWKSGHLFHLRPVCMSDVELHGIYFLFLPWYRNDIENRVISMVLASTTRFLVSWHPYSEHILPCIPAVAIECKWLLAANSISDAFTLTFNSMMATPISKG